VGAGASAAGMITSGLGVASAGGAVTTVSPVDSGGVATSAELVCAPPLLLTVTPGATCVVEEVAPAIAEAEAAEAGCVAAVDAESGDPGESVPVAVGAASVAEASVAAGDAPAASDEELDVSPVELDGSAVATPGAVTTITPIPRAAANAPTRPMYRP
jgi:hypothetical protein